MRHRLFNGVGILSLFVLAATFVLWVRSYWVFEKFIHRGVSTSSVIESQLTSISGRVVVLRDACYTDEPIAIPVEHVWLERQKKSASEVESQPQIDWMELLIARDDGVLWHGFGWVRTTASSSIFLDGKTSGTSITRIIMFPYWALAGIEILLPTYWIISVQRTRLRARSGWCSCGYDLKGNISGTCPECGMAVPGMRSADGLTDADSRYRSGD